MNTPYLIQRLQSLDAVVARANTFGAADPELASYLSAYLTVVISGVYEDCIEYLFGERSAKAGDPELAQYVKTTLDERFRNPKYGRVVETLSKFSGSYVKNLQGKVQEQARLSLDSIVDNKNLVAHGGVPSATLADVSQYYSNAKAVLDALEQVLA